MTEEQKRPASPVESGSEHKGVRRWDDTVGDFIYDYTAPTEPSAQGSGEPGETLYNIVQGILVGGTFKPWAQAYGGDRQKQRYVEAEDQLRRALSPIPGRDKLTSLEVVACVTPGGKLLNGVLAGPRDERLVRLSDVLAALNPTPQDAEDRG